MSLRYFFISVVSLSFILLFLFLPLRIAYSTVDDLFPEISYRDINGTIWSGTFEEVFYGDTLIGNLNTSVGFNKLHIKIDRGRLDLAGDISIAELIMNEVISLSSIKFIFDSDNFGSKLPMKILLSSDNLTLGFDKDRCISSSGRINAMVNDLELFGEVYETSVEADINCENNKLIANFITYPHADLLSGNIVIDNELNYEIFGSSKMLEKVLEQSLTAGVYVNPSIEFQGNIHSLLR